jgi:putative oxidoreductase
VIGFSELIGNWLVILGLFTPLSTLDLADTMATAAYQHILTAGLNIYALDLVGVLLEGSLALPVNDPGRSSFDAGMGSELIYGLDRDSAAPEADQPGGFEALITATIPIKVFRQAD